LTLPRPLRRSWKFITSGANLSERHVRSAPSPQNALDIFKGEWWSQLPEPFSNLRAGEIRSFEDPRIHWALSQFGEVQGQTALELGPLEGGHSYILEQAGFASNLAIEANPRAYLRCLVVKEIIGLHRTRFLCGDFVEYLRNSPPSFDAAFACGVLYHMQNPAELIALLSRVTDRLFLWTHYYDPGVISANPKFGQSFTGQHRSEYAGFEHSLFRYEYGRSFRLARFCGGTRGHSHWMLREDIIECLGYFGFNAIRISFDTPAPPDGPAFALVATKTGATKTGVKDLITGFSP
jgi:hypothetical protein